jgi:CheY-like chemotaxis protein
MHADEIRLSQVLGNLLLNAAKFTDRDGLVSVAVACDEAAGQAVIRVADTGIGMKPEMMPRLFLPFMQADTSLGRSRGGLGLGLALVKGLIEMHGGEINAQSAGLGKGSAFVARLPLAEAPLEETPTLPPDLPRTARRVLIIEDNADLAESLCELLQFDGHEVAVAHRGSEGLAKAREFHPEVLLCDIGLPDMNGYEVARAFQADEELKEVFLVALTGYTRLDDLKQAADAGFKRHLAKPPDLAALERVLTEADGGAAE